MPIHWVNCYCVDCCLMCSCAFISSFYILAIIACGGVRIIKFILYSMIVMTYFCCMDYSRLLIIALTLHIIRWYIFPCYISTHLCGKLIYVQLIPSAFSFVRIRIFWITYCAHSMYSFCFLQRFSFYVSMFQGDITM